MKKLFLISLFFTLSGCIEYRSINTYKLEKVKGYEIPVCVSYSQRARINTATWIDIGGKDRTNVEIDDNVSKDIVSYSYCLEELPKQVHLVEKKVNDMTICYDRNNKVELPILYCQKDKNIYQNISVYN